MAADREAACRCRPRASAACFGSGVGFAVLAALAPKCPMCVAGWLALFGIGTGTAMVIASSYTTVLMILATAVLGAGVWLWRRRRI